MHVVHRLKDAMRLKSVNEDQLLNQEHISRHLLYDGQRNIG